MADDERRVDVRDQVDAREHGDRLRDRVDVREHGDRLRDHASIDRLAADLLPALMAKLGATGLGELEVHEGDWKIRLRRPADAQGPQYGRRSTDRPSRAHPGHEGHHHAPAAVEPHRAAVAAVGDAAAASGQRGAASSAPSSPGASAAGPRGAVGPNGLRPHLAAVGPGLDPGARVGRMGHVPEGDEFAREDDTGTERAIATSPAVGIFHARKELQPGARVRAGDRLGAVDVLGVPQPVLAPVDGRLSSSLVDSGDAVEYGQELVRIELIDEIAATPAVVGPAARGGSAASSAADSAALEGAAIVRSGESGLSPDGSPPASASRPADSPDTSTASSASTAKEA